MGVGVNGFPLHLLTEVNEQRRAQLPPQAPRACGMRQDTGALFSQGQSQPIRPVCEFKPFIHSKDETSEKGHYPLK